MRSGGSPLRDGGRLLRCRSILREALVRKVPLRINRFSRLAGGSRALHTPIWLNRQAGRYMPEYHRTKGDLTSLQFFKHPERAAEAALDAQRILGVDAAILFADLLPILEPMGLTLDYPVGVGRCSPTLCAMSGTWKP